MLESVPRTPTCSASILWRNWIVVPLFQVQSVLPDKGCERGRNAAIGGRKDSNLASAAAAVIAVFDELRNWSGGRRRHLRPKTNSDGFFYNNSDGYYCPVSLLVELLWIACVFCFFSLCTEPNSYLNAVKLLVEHNSVRTWSLLN